MKRILYVLLATAVTAAAPVPLPADAVELDNFEEAVSVEESTLDDRRGAGLSGGGTIAVVVRPMPPEESIEVAPTAPALIVDRATPHVAAIHRVRSVAPDDQSAPAQLVSAAFHDATEQGDLKVVIDLPIPLNNLTAIGRRNQFAYWRTVTRGEREVHEFLADLYNAPRDHLDAPDDDHNLRI